MRPLRKKEPVLMISQTVKKKMDYLVKLTNDEIAWHGFVQKKDDNTYFWYDIIMYPQYNTSVTSSSDDEEYTKWLLRQMEFDNFEEMRLHGHSHVNMSCGPSGTDMAYRQNILKNLREGDYYIFLIVNKKGDYTIELYDFDTMVCYDKSDVTIQIGTPDEYAKAKSWAETAIKNNVRERKPICSTTSNQSNSLTQQIVLEDLMSLDAEQLEDRLEKFFQGQE